MPYPRAEDRWQLTQETLRCLLQALNKEERQALDRYQRLHGRLIFFFGRYRFVSPEDLADQVVNRIARALLDGREILNIEAFALGVARMVAREEQSRLFREMQSHLELQRNRSSVGHTSGEREETFDIMETQFTSLPKDAREMLRHYHEGAGIKRIRAREKLAAELGISIGALRKRVFDLQTMMRAKLSRSLHGSDGVPQNKEKNYL
jgi:DNA-directed RNA polymerase specialized sigma24 family protein